MQYPYACVFNALLKAIESTWKKMVTTFEGYTCLWLTSSSFLPLCKQLPHVPATPDKVTYFAYDNELKFLTPWTQTSLSSLTLSLPGILSLWWEKYLSGSIKKFFEKFSPNVRESNMGPSTFYHWVIYSLPIFETESSVAHTGYELLILWQHLPSGG